MDLFKEFGEISQLGKKKKKKKNNFRKWGQKKTMRWLGFDRDLFPPFFEIKVII